MKVAHAAFSSAKVFVTSSFGGAGKIKTIKKEDNKQKRPKKRRKKTKTKQPRWDQRE